VKERAETGEVPHPRIGFSFRKPHTLSNSRFKNIYSDIIKVAEESPSLIYSMPPKGGFFFHEALAFPL